LKLYSVAHTCEDNALIIQKSLEKLYHWSNERQLNISYQKWSIMSVGRSNSTDCFNIGSNRVQPVCVMKDLGVHVCSDLSFATHVNTTAAKVHVRACLIHKCFMSRDAITLTRTFVAYVRPILEYASVIWSPYVGCGASHGRCYGHTQGFSLKPE